ncbi:MAG TPA: 4Fe-4S binding protein [Candidatus Brocadiia bacterium]|nr:4Fe-4S binding protein [Candidatus Brocadiia bacterium]
MKRVHAAFLAAVLLSFAPCWLAGAVDRFPPPDFQSGHVQPAMSQPSPSAGWLETLDMAALAAALAAAVWISLRLRSRPAMLALSVVSLAYFGFWRRGCVCPIGSIQNFSLAIADPSFALPAVVVFYFAAPLVFALFFGRVFCAGVCPLGAIQEVVLLRPVKVPRWIAGALEMVPFFHLGLAVAVSAASGVFLTCRFDPFVGFFRLSGPAHMLIAGGLLLVISTFVARPYCRFLCPYGALLNLCSRAAWRRVTITPDKCVVCALCRDACPSDAIESANASEGTR